MTAKMDAAPSGRTEAPRGSVLQGEAKHSTFRLPHDVQMLGVIIARDHAHDAERLIREIRNREATAWLAAWRSKVDRFPYLVLAGQMDSPKAGVISGLSADWNGAVALFHYASDRFDQLAAEHRQFTACWCAIVSKEHQELFLGEGARRQMVQGRA